eukprot:jgi/Sobl393_1/780/SZX70716.1
MVTTDYGSAADREYAYGILVSLCCPQATWALEGVTCDDVTNQTGLKFVNNALAQKVILDFQAELTKQGWPEAVKAVVAVRQPCVTFDINSTKYASYRVLVRFDSTTTTAVKDTMFLGAVTGPCVGGYSKTLYSNVAALFKDFKVSQNIMRQLLPLAVVCLLAAQLAAGARTTPGRSLLRQLVPDNITLGRQQFVQATWALEGVTCDDVTNQTGLKYVNNTLAQKVILDFQAELTKQGWPEAVKTVVAVRQPCVTFDINSTKYASYRVLVRFDSTTTTAVKDTMFLGAVTGPCVGGYSKTLYSNVAALFKDFKVSQNNGNRQNVWNNGVPNWIEYAAPNMTVCQPKPSPSPSPSPVPVDSPSPSPVASPSPSPTPDTMFLGAVTGPCVGGYSKTLYSNVAALFKDFKVSQNNGNRQNVWNNGIPNWIEYAAPNMTVCQPKPSPSPSPSPVPVD